LEIEDIEWFNVVKIDKHMVYLHFL
jgi:hypothetical protein